MNAANPCAPAMTGARADGVRVVSAVATVVDQVLFAGAPSVQNKLIAEKPT